MSRAYVYRSERLVAAGFEVVWSTLLDVETWPGFIAGLRTVEMERVVDDELLWRCVGSPLGVDMQYTISVRPDYTSGRVEVELDWSSEEHIDVLANSWRVEAVGSGAATRVSLAGRFHSSCPGRAAVDEIALEHSVCRSMEGLALRVEPERFI